MVIVGAIVSDSDIDVGSLVRVSLTPNKGDGSKSDCTN